MIKNRSVFYKSLANFHIAYEVLSLCCYQISHEFFLVIFFMMTIKILKESACSDVGSSAVTYQNLSSNSVIS